MIGISQQEKKGQITIVEVHLVSHSTIESNHVWISNDLPDMVAVTTTEFFEFMVEQAVQEHPFC